VLPGRVLGKKLLKRHCEQRQRVGAGEGVNEMIDKGGIEDVAIGVQGNLSRSTNDVSIGRWGQRRERQRCLVQSHLTRRSPYFGGA
jgi:hypothetical protein